MLKEVLVPLSAESGIELDFTLAGDVRDLSEEAERNLLLVVKETLTNAIRHGAPSKVDVYISYETEGLSIRVVDDGSGFDVSQAPPEGHFGLQGMHERVGQFDGKLCVESEPGKGTTVVLTIPSTQKWEVKG